MKPPSLPRTLLVRSLLVQGSWNYRTMIGGGFGYCLLPLLRSLPGGDEEARERLSRHVEHFNSHPYLAGVALGAVARMEEEGMDPEAVRRFKTAIRGPLGGVGDRLVWASWLPTTLLGAVTLALLGTPWWIVLPLFLGAYNGVHLALRWWGLRVGLRDGPRVAEALQRANLQGLAERIASIGVLLLGVALGLLVTWGLAEGPAQVVGPWVPVAALLFLAGARKGAVLWSWTLGGAVAGLLVVGILGNIK